MIIAIFLFLIGLVAFLFGLLMFQRAESVWQETAAVLFWVIAAVLYVGGFIYSELRSLSKQLGDAADELRKLNMQVARKDSHKENPGLDSTRADR